MRKLYMIVEYDYETWEDFLEDHARGSLPDVFNRAESMTPIISVGVFEDPLEAYKKAFEIAREEGWGREAKPPFSWGAFCKTVVVTYEDGDEVVVFHLEEIELHEKPETVKRYVPKTRVEFG